ncbi:MAG: hypothetical protein R3330_02265, partial [Saprospiraceae bacterium]|nr:hypothetical protein [Saprospiraceae bacterium]
MIRFTCTSILIGGLFLTGHGLLAQDACLGLRNQADNLAHDSRFIDAYDYYQQAAACHLERKHYSSSSEASLYALDCLIKGFEYKRYYEESAALFAFIHEHVNDIPQDSFDFFESSIECFNVVSELNYGNTDKTFRLLDTLIGKYEQFVDEGHNPRFFNQRLVQCFNWRADAHQMTGDYHRAIADSREALRRIAPFRSVYVEDGGILDPHLAIARCYAALGESDRVAAHYDSVRQLIPQLTRKRHERALGAYATIFNYYLDADLLDSARVYLDRIREVQTPEHAHEIWQMAGHLSYCEGHDQQALQALERALTIVEERQGERNEAVAHVHLLLGKTTFRLGDMERSLDHLHQGLLAVSDNYRDPDQLSAPPNEALYRQRDLLETLLYKSMVLRTLYQRKGTPDLLKAAWRNIDAGVQFLNQLHTGYVSDQDRRLIIEKGYPVFELAISIAHQYDGLQPGGAWVDTAFILMEQSKALNLLDAVLHERVKQYAGIPDSLIVQEARLKLEITNRAVALRTLRQQTTDAAAIRTSEDALHNAE